VALVKIINIIELGRLSNIEDSYGCPGFNNGGKIKFFNWY